MAPDPVSIVTKVVEWIVRSEKEGKAQISAYVDEIRDACRDLTRVDDPTGREAIYLHEQIKQMYDCASTQLPPAYLEGSGGTLYRALSSARIYYWLRFLEAQEPDDLRRLLRDRAEKSSSFERVADMIAEMLETPDGDIDLSAVDVDQLQRECLRDVARLSRIKPI